MKARYIGGEGEAGSRNTKLFGITVYCDQVFDVPSGFENKARLNPYVEVIEEKAPAPIVVTGGNGGVAAPAEKPTRKRKEKDNGEPVA